MSFDVHEAALNRHDHGFRTVPDLQLGEDVFHMDLDRALLASEDGRNVPVGEALRDQLQDLELARCELRARSELRETRRDRAEYRDRLDAPAV